MKLPMLLSSAVLLVAAPVAAQTATWTEQCTTAGTGPANYVTCASAKLSYEAGTGYMNFWFWNMSGAAGTGSYSGGIIDNVGFHGLFTDLNSYSSLTAYSPAGVDQTCAWAERENLQGEGSLDARGWDRANGAKIPCTGPNNTKSNFQGVVSNAFTSPGAGHVVTSWGGAFPNAFGDPQLGGYLFRFFVGLSYSWNPADIALYFHVREATNGDSDQYFCAPDGVNGSCEPPCIPGTPGCDNPGGPQETVPEPATMTLLATGLVGLAASRRRRKSVN